jgi:hypothetical protein
LFPLFLESGLRKIVKNRQKSKKDSGEKSLGEVHLLQESIISIATQLCNGLYDSQSPNCYVARILNKFIENECEKLERLVELFFFYNESLARTDRNIGAARQTLLANHDLNSEEDIETLLAEFDDEENIYMQVCGCFHVSQPHLLSNFFVIGQTFDV